MREDAGRPTQENDRQESHKDSKIRPAEAALLSQTMGPQTDQLQSWKAESPDPAPPNLSKHGNSIRHQLGLQVPQLVSHHRNGRSRLGIVTRHTGRGAASDIRVANNNLF